MLPGLHDDGQMPGRTQSLYRKYRPTTFEDDELVGQEHISRTLRNAIASGRVAHAYLFCGPRGTGKTSTARLLAKAVNCLDPDPARRPCNVCEACRAINENRATDIIEIDAASNRGIDDIRNLREQVRYAPTQLQHKFYIVDEAHQITKDAFNAFLKTLEEPPPNTTFVLATTDPDKLPETIASRCQRFDFRRIPRGAAMEHVRRVCEREGMTIDDDALEIVVRRSTGSLRDALSLVDMLATAASGRDAGRIDAELVRQMLGITTDGWEYDLARSLADRDIAAGLRVIGQAADAGHDMRSFGKRVLDLLRLLMLVRAGADPIEANDRIRELAQRFEIADLLRVNERFSEVDFKQKHGSFPQLPLEIALVGSLVEQPAVVYGAPQAEVRQSAPPRRVVESRPPQRPEPVAPVSSPVAAAGRGWQPDPRPERVDRVERSEPVVVSPSTPPARAVTPPAAVAPPASTSQVNDDRHISLDTVVANWDRIRTEVKALDRKVEALLASTDPGHVDSDTLYMVAAYPFHAAKLNEAKAREIVEDAFERAIGKRHNVVFTLREELPVGAGMVIREQSPSGSGFGVSRSTSNGTGRATAVVDAPRGEHAVPDEPVPPLAMSDDDAFVRMVEVHLDAEEVEPDEIPPLS